MQYRLFTVPVKSPHQSQEEMNRFLRGQRVLSVEKRFVSEGEAQYWSFCVEYMEGQPGYAAPREAGERLDYKRTLSPEDFEVFARLRAARKEISERDAVPAYTVFTNEQLAQMVKRRAATKADLEKIPGVGAARLSKYGDAALAVLKGAFPE